MPTVQTARFFIYVVITLFFKCERDTGPKIIIIVKGRVLETCTAHILNVDNRIMSTSPLADLWVHSVPELHHANGPERM